MHTIIYTSRYTGNEHSISSDLYSICQSSKLKNPAKDITGVLFYHQKIFLQVIEGEKNDLEELMHTLEKDSRHCDLKRVVDEKIIKKSFHSWNMDTFNVEDSQTINYEKIAEFKSLYSAILKHVEPHLFIESLKYFLQDPHLKSVYS